LKKDGNNSFIIPNSLLLNSSYQKLRNKLFDGLDLIVKLPDGIFESAIVETIIYRYKKAAKSKNCRVILYGREEAINGIDENDFLDIPKSSWSSETPKFNIYFSTERDKILSKIETDAIQLSDISDFSLGITPYDKYKGHSQKTIDSREFHSNKKIDETYKPLISGDAINRYKISDSIEEYIKYGDWLGAKREERFFKEPRIILRQIVSGNPPRIFAGYTDEDKYFTQIGFGLIVSDKSFDIRYLLAVINSLLVSFYHKYRFLDIEKEVFQKLLIENCKKLPIKKLNKKQQQPLISLAEKMIALHKSQSGLSQKYLELLQANFKFKPTAKLKKWPELEFIDVLAELEKAGIKIPPAKQGPWLDLFKTEREKIKNTQTEIEKTDKEIDKLVYQLYGLSEEEIAVVERG
jgi:hypothetical protein